MHPDKLEEMAQSICERAYELLPTAGVPFKLDIPLYTGGSPRNGQRLSPLIDLLRKAAVQALSELADELSREDFDAVWKGVLQKLISSQKFAYQIACGYAWEAVHLTPKGKAAVDRYSRDIEAFRQDIPDIPLDTSDQDD